MKQKNKKGVTLIEVMAVIAIISIFAVISYKNLANNRNHAEVEAVASEIASLINQTRNFALTGKVVNGNVPGCFAIRFQNYTGQNEYLRFLGNDTCVYVSSWGAWQKISSKVKISGFLAVPPVSDRSSFRYKVPDGERLTGTANNWILVESKADSTIQKTVKINQYRAYVE